MPSVYRRLRLRLKADCPSRRFSPRHASPEADHGSIRHPPGGLSGAVGALRPGLGSAHAEVAHLLAAERDVRAVVEDDMHIRIVPAGPRTATRRAPRRDALRVLYDDQ